MPLSPSLSQDLPALTATYAHTVQSILDLGRSLRPGDTERETDCPGWTVHDQFAHIVSLEAWVQGESAPDVDVSGRAHVRTELDALVERYLESRRGRPVEELLEELEDLAATRIAHLQAETTSPDEPATGPFGPTTLVGLMQNRVFDLWNHEQDIREAIDRPGNLDSAGAAHMVRTLFAAFPRIVARTAGVPAGQAVILDLTGPLVGRAGVRVEEHDGKPHGIPLFAGAAEEHADVVTTTITLSTRAATRRGAGRVSTADTHYTVTGDDSIARRVLDALVIAP
ncbi:maleylpyruvate isomerase family mycothiol-dependent enzyme [Knoellia sp. Soil729]|uniref:maleylpyruvate isomerase family mycothiol-dependent enzyme n=1 Tax=Knoellia sp. Soil729 TaxID=1736394 RepID=UPI00138F124A|nr:maleylpyruvate isomerase family mycothiol-dependent enzyme [Knoellia sp. Soil729]